MKNLILLCLILLAFPLESFSTAGVNLYGVGSKQAGNSNSPTLLKDQKKRLDPFLGHTAPAALGWIERSAVSYTMLGAFSNFKNTGDIKQSSISGEVWAPFESDGDYDPNMSFLWLHGFGIAAPIGKSPKVILSISAVFPVQRLMTLDSGPNFSPHYSIYDNQAQHPSANFNLSHALNDNWSVSVGGRLYTAMEGATQVDLTPTGGSTPTTAQQMDVRPKQKVSPVASVMYKKSEDFALSLSLRKEVKWTSKLDVLNYITTTNTVMRFETTSMVYFEPAEAELNSTTRVSDDLTALAGVSFQYWKEYETPRIKITPQSGAGPVVQDFGDVKTRNTLNPKAGVIYRLNDGVALRGGVSYRPTPFEQIPTGNYNPVDTDSLILSSGAGFELGNPFKIAYPLELDFHFQYHHLFNETVTKDDANTIGGPSYEVGGSVTSFGMSATTQF